MSLRTYTITVVRSRKGWLASLPGFAQTASVDSTPERPGHPGRAALDLAAKLWPRGNPRVCQVGRNALRYTVQVEVPDAAATAPAIREDRAP